MKSILENIIDLIEKGARIGQFTVGAVEKLNNFGSMLLSIDYSKIPDRIKIIGETWGKFGWVPMLPTYSALEFYNSSLLPSSQEDADQKMLTYLTDDCVEELIKQTKEYVDKFNGNSQTFDEAIKCYNIGLYTSCSLALCALIDGAFLKFQKIQNEKRRSLSNNAIDNFEQKSEMQRYLISISSIKTSIKEIFKSGKNFLQEDKDYMRNYVSHGMNRHIPTKIDCLKLLIILYNTYILFDADVFHREDINI